MTQDTRKTLKIFIAALFLSVTPLTAFASEAAHILEEMPVQHGGRIKPFQSFAKEVALNVVGAETFGGLSAAELLWDWVAKPDEWNIKPMIQLPHLLREEFGLRVIKGRVSPESVLNQPTFTEKLKIAWDKRKRKDRLSLEEQNRLELYDKAVLFQEVAKGSLPGWLAHPNEPQQGWLPLQGFSPEEAQQNFINLYSPELISNFMLRVGALAESWRGGFQSAETQEAARNFSEAQKKLFESAGIHLDQKHLNTELLYNRLHTFGWAAKLYFAAVVLFGIALLFPAARWQKPVTWLGSGFFTAGFLMHLFGFVLRCMIAGRPPVTNMYESVIWVSWAAVFFAVILFAVYRSIQIPFIAAIVGTFALWIAESFPVTLNPAISPLVPVLRSNLWLTVHVLTITMGYGAFALAWGLGHAVVFGYMRNPNAHESLRPLSSFLYRALQIGVILLAAGTVLGGVWANYSWGRFWGWDPKETWALIALLGYLVVLHGRFAGWLNTFSAAAGSVIAFAGVVMAWYGVNFVLAAGLHSYGFGGGGAPYVVAVALADILLILAMGARYNQKKRQASVKTV